MTAAKTSDGVEHRFWLELAHEWRIRVELVEMDSSEVAGWRWCEGVLSRVV